ncbi:uncharacterized protein A4U43_C02F2830 [Asparagus officinalis]|uniref:Uncharacterized protein n=1 Tax=Asparagus officinalis TaxID=4686 RepID=A0A5P1FH69_ASPOF|nr:uncharacterized protein A4U43_C02F2830 [Asparagus officinalis]
MMKLGARATPGPVFLDTLSLHGTPNDSDIGILSAGVGERVVGFLRKKRRRRAAAVSAEVSGAAPAGGVLRGVVLLIGLVFVNRAASVLAYPGRPFPRGRGPRRPRVRARVVGWFNPWPLEARLVDMRGTSKCNTSIETMERTEEGEEEEAEVAVSVEEEEKGGGGIDERRRGGGIERYILTKNGRFVRLERGEGGHGVRGVFRGSLVAGRQAVHVRFS